MAGNPLSSLGYVTPTSAPIMINHADPSTHIVALAHPLLVPEALEPQIDDLELASKRTVKRLSFLSNAHEQQKKNSLIYIKSQPRFLMMEWVDNVGHAGKPTSSNKQRSLVSFLGEIAPMFVPKETSTSVIEGAPLPPLSVEPNNQPQQSHQTQSSGTLKPLESLHPLRRTSLIALCSAMLCDRPIPLKTLWQRINDGINNQHPKDGGTHTFNAFQDLLEDLAENVSLADNKKDKERGKTSTDVKSKASATKRDINKLLQWVLFLSNPAGHVTPLAFIEETSKQSYATTSITPQQLKEKAFELQVRFYSFVDEKWFLACHLPGTTSTSNSTALNTIQTIATKALSNLAKLNESAVVGAATSVHGLLPNLNERNDRLISLLRKSQTENDSPSEALIEDDDDDDNASDIGSLVSGVSGSVVGGGISRRPVTHKAFRRQFGSRSSNELKFRSLCLISSVTFGRLVSVLSKYVSLETLSELKEFVRGGCLTDANGGMTSLFSSQGRSNLSSGGDKGSSNSGPMSTKSGENKDANLIVDLAWLNTILQRTELVSELIGYEQGTKYSDVQKLVSETNELASQLRKTAHALPSMLAAHAEQAKRDVNSQQFDLGESEYSRSQKPIINFLLRMISSEISDRGNKSGGGMEEDGITDNDGTASQVSKKQSASLNLMIIQSKQKGAGTSSGTTDNNKSTKQQDEGEAARRVAVYRKRLHELFINSASNNISETLEKIAEISWSTVPKPDLSLSASAPNPKRQREEDVQTKNDTMSPPSSVLRTERGTTLKEQQLQVTKKISAEKINKLADLPMKVTFDWTPFYSNPSSTSSTTSSNNLKPLWIRASEREQHILDLVVSVFHKYELEFGFYTAIGDTTATSHNYNEGSARPNNAQSSSNLPIPKVEAMGREDVRFVSFAKTMGVAPTSDTKSLLTALLEAMSGEGNKTSQSILNKIGTLLAHSISVNRVRTAKRDKPNSTAGTNQSNSLPKGIIKWILGSSDATLKNKIGDLLNKGHDNSSSTATSAATTPNPLTILNGANSKKVLEKLAASEVASAHVRELSAYLTKTTSEVTSLAATYEELRRFSASSHSLLEQFESLLMDINAFLSANGSDSTPSTNDNANNNDWLSLLVIGHIPAPTAVPPQGSISFPDLDQSINDRSQWYLLPQGSTWQEHSVLSSEALKELVSFIFSNVKRAHRLRGLQRLAEESALAIAALIASLKEEMWLLSV